MEKGNINFQNIECKVRSNYYTYFSLDEFKKDEKDSKYTLKEKKIRQINDMLKTVEQFIKEYPEMLNDEEILKQEKILDDYIRKNNLLYTSCFSYSDKSEAKKDNYNITRIDGLRVSSTCYRTLNEKTKLIHLSNYYIVNDKPRKINELSFRLKDDMIIWNDLVERINDSAEFYYDSIILDYIMPKKYLKIK